MYCVNFSDITEYAHYHAIGRYIRGSYHIPDNVTMDAILQMMMFLNRLTGTQVGISAMKLFVVDKSTILTVPFYICLVFSSISERCSDKEMVVVLVCVRASGRHTLLCAKSPSICMRFSCYFTNYYLHLLTVST